MRIRNPLQVTANVSLFWWFINTVIIVIMGVQNNGRPFLNFVKSNQEVKYVQEGRHVFKLRRKGKRDN